MHRYLVVLAALGLLACGSSSSSSSDPDANTADPADAADPGSYEDPLVQLSVLGRPQGGGASHPQQMLFKTDDLMLYCGTPAGLYLVDMSNASSMARTTTLQPNGFRRCQHLAISGDRVYVTSRGDESAPPSVSLFDLSSTTPQTLPSYTRSDLSYEGVAATGTIAYVAVHDNGILVLDWQSGSPVEIGSLSTGFANAWGVALVGSTLFIADAGYGLVTVNVSNPALPSIMGSVALPDGTAQGIVIDGNHAYLAMATGGVAVVDISNTAQPAFVTTVDTPGSATELSLDSPYLAVADWNDMRIFDMSTPSAPVLVASEIVLDNGRNFTRFLGVALRGDILVGGEFGGSLYSHQFYPERVAPDIRTDSYSIAFARTDAGDADAVALVVRNEGRATLVATSVTVTGDAFSTDAGPFSLAPGEAKVIEVLFQPDDTSGDTGSLTIATDDPDEATTTVDLAGNGSTLQVGDPAPEVEISLLGGGTWRLSEQTDDVIVLAYFATF